MQIDSLVTALDLIATFAFAIVGARIAASKGLEITVESHLLRLLLL